MSLNLIKGPCSGAVDPNHLGMVIGLDELLTTTDPLLTIRLVNYLAETTQSPPGAEHRRFVESISDLAVRRDAILALSVFCHEVRHFHDLLLTPYGSFLVRQALQLNMVYFVLARDAVIAECPAIYVPISKWVSFVAAHTNVPELQQPPPALVEYERVFKLITGRLSTYELGHLKQLSVTATAVMEGSAILAQEEHIRSHFGVDAVGTFWASLSGEAPKEYLLSRDFMPEFFGVEPALDVQAYLLFAALCGDYRSESSIALPADLYWELLTKLKRAKTNVQSPGEVSTLVSRHFEDVGWGSLTQCMRKAHQENCALLDAYSKQWRVSGTHESVINCLDAYADYLVIQESLIEWFVNDPSLYFDLRKYVRAIHDLPLPPLYLECNRGLPFSAELTRSFGLEDGTAFKLAELPSELREQLQEFADSEGFVRFWHLIYLLNDPSTFADKVDRERWREQARWSTCARYLTAAPRSLVPAYQAQTQEFFYDSLGTRVYGGLESQSPLSIRCHPDSMPEGLQKHLDALKTLKEGRPDGLQWSNATFEIDQENANAVRIEIPFDFCDPSD